MSKPSDILNPENPLLDSEEEDDDFEPGIAELLLIVRRSSNY